MTPKIPRCRMATEFLQTLELRTKRQLMLLRLFREVVVRRGNAPRSIPNQANALLLSDRTEDWPDTNGSIWFIALAKEQLALVTHNRFHEFPLVDG
jgi:hypothetical protein